jgi:hypothetical protein
MLGFAVLDPTYAKLLSVNQAKNIHIFDDMIDCRRKHPTLRKPDGFGSKKIPLKISRSFTCRLRPRSCDGGNNG